jgi:alkylated DNA repair dioxygenase AlkB
VYRDGQDSVAWHSDDEPDMGDPIVASISLGCARDFLFRAINPVAALASAVCPNKGRVKLEHGSLLTMGRGVQSTYQHCLPKRAKAGRRINLTFRARG